MSQTHVNSQASDPLEDPLVNRSGGAPTSAPSRPADAASDVEDGLEEGADGELDEAEGEYEIAPSGWRAMFRSAGACTASMLLHVLGLISLSLWILPSPVQRNLDPILASAVDRPKEELEEVQLDPELVPATDMSASAAAAVASEATATGMEGLAGAVSSAVGVGPQLDQKVMREAQSLGDDIQIDHPLAGAPSSSKLIQAVPDEGFKGEARMIADNYDQAFDMITREIMWMLDRGDVLVIWCFDQSGSMKDDQREIQGRINKVYSELGLTGRTNSTHLLSAVTSYGASFAVHTPKPTGETEQIRYAIQQVPEDQTGQEEMCAAVIQSLALFGSHAKRRQVAMILVTDESGERESNMRLLEEAVSVAKALKCKVYTLGREAVFGYPYAYYRWQDKNTLRHHWLPIDRGPETAFVEQLQTNGFHRRHDAFGSGFGPYEQTRLSRETGGIFFMLPGVETNIVRGTDRRYELEILRPYRPDLRARLEVVADRDNAQRYPVRPFLWQVINSLNPWNPKAARSIEMRVAFNLDPRQFVQEARMEQEKAKRFILFLGEVERILEEGRQFRDQEPEPRWQANYDLIYAQVVSYQARLYEYGAALEDFVKNPQTAPRFKMTDSTPPKQLILVHWDIATRKEIRVPDVTQSYIVRANEMFQTVIKNHPNTPWAERAKEEMNRGYGVHLVPDYDYPIPPGVVPMPRPKL